MCIVTLHVELFGVPRLLVGQRHLTIQSNGPTLAEAARALAAAHPELLGKVLEPGTGWPLEGYTFAVETRFTRDPATPLRPDTSLLLVSSQAGG